MHLIIVTYPGMGERERVEMAGRSCIGCGLRSSHPVRGLWVARMNTDNEPGALGNTEKGVLECLNALPRAPYLSKMDWANFRVQGHTDNTRTQSDWVVEQLASLETPPIAVSLCVTPWHLPRAYMTLVQAMLDARMMIPIIACPTYQSPERVIELYGVPAWEMVRGEVNRILRYQSEGDIASFKELRDYLNWLYRKLAH